MGMDIYKHLAFFIIVLGSGELRKSDKFSLAFEIFNHPALFIISLGSDKM